MHRTRLHLFLKSRDLLSSVGLPSWSHLFGNCLVISWPFQQHHQPDDDFLTSPWSVSVREGGHPGCRWQPCDGFLSVPETRLGGTRGNVSRCGTLLCPRYEAPQAVYSKEECLQSECPPVQQQEPSDERNRRYATLTTKLFSPFDSLFVVLFSYPVTHQYRLAHTDIQIPDFTPYRRTTNKDLKKGNNETVDDRRAFTYLVTAGVGVGGAVAAKHAVQGVLNMLAPARDCLALSKIEVSIANIPEGKNVTVKWRGKSPYAILFDNT